MPLYIDRLTTKIRLTKRCLSGFELYSCWVPLETGKFDKNDKCGENGKFDEHLRFQIRCQEAPLVKWQFWRKW